MKVGVLVFPGVEELDFAGPWELLSLWGKLPGGPQAPRIVAQSLEPVPCAKGLSVNPHFAFQTCPDLDVLVVPGGLGTRTQVPFFQSP